MVLAPLIAALKKGNQPNQLGPSSLYNSYALQCIEFLTICAQSQHSMVNQVFQTQMALDSHGLGNELANFFKVRIKGSFSMADSNSSASKRLEKLLAYKIISLLSVMAQEKVGLKFV